MTPCAIGSLGGLLFLGLVVVLICAGLAGLLFGWVLVWYFDDVMRVEAMDGKLHKGDDK